MHTHIDHKLLVLEVLTRAFRAYAQQLAMLLETLPNDLKVAGDRSMEQCLHDARALDREVNWTGFAYRQRSELTNGRLSILAARNHADEFLEEHINNGLLDGLLMTLQGRVAPGVNGSTWSKLQEHLKALAQIQDTVLDLVQRDYLAPPEATRFVKQSPEFTSELVPTSPTEPGKGVVFAWPTLIDVWITNKYDTARSHFMVRQDDYRRDGDEACKGVPMFLMPAVRELAAAVWGLQPRS